MALLHRATTPDWSRQPKAQWNYWQRLADRTHGIVTPGNALSVIGFVIVLYGLYLLIIDELLAAVLAISLGRLVDVADGAVADYTGTKSPLGALIDTVVDKLILGLSCLVLWAYNLVPQLILVLLLAHVTYNASMTGLAKFRHVNLYPSATGKAGTLFEWLAITSFLLHHAAENSQQMHLADIMLGIAVACSIGFIALAGYSSLRYSQQLSRKAK
jgi:phosphatidylglycerophosphate synthase